MGLLLSVYEFVEFRSLVTRYIYVEKHGVACEPSERVRLASTMFQTIAAVIRLAPNAPFH